MKQEVLDYVAQNAHEVFAISDEIFDHPEVGFEEYRACALLTGWLEGKGYAVERGVHGLETAFRARYSLGDGGIRIGLLCEYDALPMGHACGHQLQGPIMLLAAEAIRHNFSNVPYELVIYGTPAEEGGQGKVKMLENGAFDDIDLALMTHASPNTTTDVKSLANCRYNITFTGTAAHESLNPELSRSAFDAMLLSFTGLEFLRGHVKEDVKFFTQIIGCTGVAGFTGGNALAQCQVGIRTYEDSDLPDIERRVLEVMRGAAIMTETSVECEKVSSCKGKLPSLTLNRIIMQNAAELDMPNQLAFRERTGSTDFAEVTHKLPGAVSRFVLVPEGVSSHSQEFIDNGKGKPAQEGIIMGAQLIAATVFDLLDKPELVEETIEEFNTRKALYASKAVCAV